MEAGYWHDRWDAGDIGFHRAEPHDFLTRHFSKLGLEKGTRIFVPLCGMSVDMKWLWEQGHAVVGAELHRPAVEGFFEMIGEQAEVEQFGELLKFSACEESVVIYQGDILTLDAAQLGPVDGVYDRGAIVALPPQMRPSYAQQMKILTGQVAQLIVAYDYDQTQTDGPPFSVPEDELSGYYGGTHALELVEAYSSETLREKRGESARELVWCLHPKDA